MANFMKESRLTLNHLLVRLDVQPLARDIELSGLTHRQPQSVQW